MKTELTWEDVRDIVNIAVPLTKFWENDQHFYEGVLLAYKSLQEARMTCTGSTEKERKMVHPLSSGNWLSASDMRDRLTDVADCWVSPYYLHKWLKDGLLEGCYKKVIYGEKKEMLLYDSEKVVSLFNSGKLPGRFISYGSNI